MLLNGWVGISAATFSPKMCMNEVLKTMENNHWLLMLVAFTGNFCPQSTSTCLQLSLLTDTYVYVNV